MLYMFVITIILIYIVIIFKKRWYEGTLREIIVFWFNNVYLNGEIIIILLVS